MNLDDPEEKKRGAEWARAQLESGTWPAVSAVFVYENPRAPRTADDEFARLKTFFEGQGCTHIPEFIDIARDQQEKHGVAVSFNLSMRWRVNPVTQEPVTDPAEAVFTCPDVLVGTRNGLEAAPVWFKNLALACPGLLPELLQVTDKIFSEAVAILSASPEEEKVATAEESTVH